LQARGRYFFPHSARCIDAVASLSDDGTVLRIADAQGAVLAAIPVKNLDISARLGTVRRRLSFPDGAGFDTADNDVIDVMLKKRGWLHRLESSWRTVLVSVIFAGLAVAGFALYGIPAAAAVMARHTPASVAHFASTQALDTLDGHVLQASGLSPSVQAQQQSLFRQVAAQAPPNPGGYRLLLRNAPLVGPNAFALPDGTIVATDQIILLAHSGDEMQGVYAHEISHVVHAHSLQRIYQASLVPAAIAFITGDASQLGHIATILPGVLLQSSYSRSFEQQADDDAAAAMRRMGKNPASLAGLLERIDTKICGRGNCGPSWLSSHPATMERAARLRGE